MSQVEEDSGDIPYVTAKEGNNSILAYVKDIGALKEEKNTIFIGGKTLVITFQDRDYYSNDSHNLILKLKGELDADFRVYLYLVTALAKSLSYKYTWGNSISKAKINSDYVFLPVKDIDNDELDFSYMGKLIRLLEEKIIMNLMAYF